MSDEKGPSHAELARTLVASQREGALCTLARDPITLGGELPQTPRLIATPRSASIRSALAIGHPYGSYVIYALRESAPIFLISRLAEHTQNLLADARASLLVVSDSGDEALARARVTLVGTCRLLAERADLEAIFLARHPTAESYVHFADFSFWELEVESARYIGGFGRMSWIDVDAWTRAEADPLADAAPSILEHMNSDHTDACLAYAHAFAEESHDATSAVMVAVDRYGFDLRIDDSRTERIAFAAPVSSPDEVRRTLIAMVREARATKPRRS